MAEIPFKERKVIAVIGDSIASKKTIEIAREVGVLIAERKGILVCGGLGGVMEAAAEGASSAGGLTIGILPVYEKEAANQHLDIVIPTGMGHARNVIITAFADGVIAIGGKFGTLSEIGHARSMGKFEIRKGGKIQADILQADTPRHAVSRLWKILETS